jgi:hypothetical protein
MTGPETSGVIDRVEPEIGRMPGAGQPAGELLDLLADRIESGESHGWMIDRSRTTITVREDARPLIVPVESVSHKGTARVQEATERLKKAFRKAQKKDLNLVGEIRPVFSGDENRPALEVPVGRWVGFTTLEVEGRQIHLQVDPKIENADYLGLLEKCGKLKGVWEKDADVLERAPRSPVQLLVWAYSRALLRLLRGGEGRHGDSRPQSGGLRRLHEVHEAVLRCQVRGRVEIPRYLKYIAGGLPDHVPCRFQAHDLDNRPNRLLRFALHVCLTLARHLVPDRRTSGVEFSRAVERLRELDYHFGAVPLVQERDDGREFALPASFNHYVKSGALPLARLILRNVSLGPERGRLPSVSIALDMAQLFEEAFAAVLARKFRKHRADIAQLSWRIRVDRMGRTGQERPILFRPDVFVNIEEGNTVRSLVADTKWKHAVQLDEATAGGEPLRVSSHIAVHSSDVQQILAYAYLAAQRAETTARAAAEAHFPKSVLAILVYPAEQREKPRKILLDRDDDAGKLEVHVLPWCITVGQLENGTEQMLKEIDLLLG